MKAGGLHFTREEWDNEWKEIIRLASDKPRTPNISPTRKISRQYSIAMSPGRRDSIVQSPDNFESLEEFHVFALAQILRRPIIVIADTMLRDIEGVPVQPINFSGIYLPIECDPEQCYKYPLILGYSSAHFAALVPAEGEDTSMSKQKLSSSIPLSRQNLELLPIQFLRDPGSDWIHTEQDSEKRELPELSRNEQLSILSNYLQIVKVSNAHKSKTSLSSSKANIVSEVELSPGEFGHATNKKDKKGGKSTVVKALESISTLMTGPTNPVRFLTRSNSNDQIYAARLDLHNRPKYFAEMITNYIETAKERLEKRVHSAKQQATQTKCITPGCNYFSAEDTNFLCSRCYQYQREVTARQTSTSMPTLREQAGPQLELAKRHASDPTNPRMGVESDKNIVPTTNLIDFATQKSLIDFSEQPVAQDDFIRSKTAPILYPYRGSNLPSQPISDYTAPPYHERMQPTAPYQSFDPPPYQDTNIQSLGYRPLPERLPGFEPVLAYGGREAVGNTHSVFPLRHQQQQPVSNIPTSDMHFNGRDVAYSNPPTIGPAFTPMQQTHAPNAQPGPLARSRLCRRDGCKFYGTEELDHFCSSCYSRQYAKTGYV